MKTVDISDNELLQYYSQISSNIIKIRKEKKISQLNLATSIGHTSATFLGKAEILAENKHFNLEHLLKIAIALDVDITDFFEGIETKELKNS